MQTKTTYTVNVVKTLSGNQIDLTTLTEGDRRFKKYLCRVNITAVGRKTANQFDSYDSSTVFRPRPPPLCLLF